MDPRRSPMSLPASLPGRGLFPAEGVAAGQDGLNATANITTRDLFALQSDFIHYVNMDNLVPKLLARQLLTDAEVYMVQNPYIVPDQRVFHLLQYVGNKGPKAPTKLLQCLVEEPLHQGHMYLAARLLGETKKDASESSSPVIHRPNPDVNKRITKLKIKFADLLLETHKFLYESNVSIQEFRIFVSFLSASNDNRSSLYFRDHLPSISSASTLDQIFAILNENQYWNHFNYHLLEAVVEKYGNEKIRKLLSHYAEEVSDFQSSVSLSDYCVTLPFADRVPSKPDFTRIITRQEESWTDYSLKKVHDMHSSLCGEFDLPKHALMFQMADKGSVMIRWMVPISVEATVYVRALERKGRMAALGIQKIIIGDRSITFIHNDGRGGDEDDDDDIDVDNVDSEASEEEEEDYVDVNNEKVSKKAAKKRRQDISKVKASLRMLETKLKQLTTDYSKHKDFVQIVLCNLEEARVAERQEMNKSPRLAVAGPATTKIPSQDSITDDKEEVWVGVKPLVSQAHAASIKSEATGGPPKLHRKDSDYDYDRDHWIEDDSGYGEPGRWRKNRTTVPQ